MCSGGWLGDREKQPLISYDDDYLFLNESSIIDDPKYNKCPR